MPFAEIARVLSVSRAAPQVAASGMPKDVYTESGLADWFIDEVASAPSSLDTGKRVYAASPGVESLPDMDDDCTSCSEDMKAHALDGVHITTDSMTVFLLVLCVLWYTLLRVMGIF
jgi:hypothetical protein